MKRKKAVYALGEMLLKSPQDPALSGIKALILDLAKENAK